MYEMMNENASKISILYGPDVSNASARGDRVLDLAWAVATNCVHMHFLSLVSNNNTTVISASGMFPGLAARRIWNLEEILLSI